MAGLKRETDVLRERVRLAFSLTPTMQASSLIVAIVLGFSVRNLVPAPKIAAWVALVSLVAVARGAMYLAFKKIEKEPFNGPKWEKTYVLSSLASGLVWGSSAFVILPVDNVPLTMFFVMVVASLSAATTVSHSALRMGPTAWVAPVMLCYAVRMFANGGETGAMVDALILLYTTTILYYSFKHNDAIHESISLRFENLELLEEVRNSALQKEKFITLVSHDLRAPLSGIKGMLEVGLELDEGGWREMRSGGGVTQIIKTLDALLGMVEKLLNHSRLKTGKMWPKKRGISAKKLVDGQIGALLHTAASKEISVHNQLPEDMVILADPELYGQMMQNILSNAVKFTPRGGSITVLRPWPDKAAISVKDTGVGLNKEMQSNVFSGEVQTTTFGTEGEKGTGLGLPYSYDIMKAHGGDLIVYSPTGAGTTFKAILPKEEPS